jgi:hypothetical protein
MRWYKQYLIVLKRFRSGMTPLVLDLCCKSGGASEGIRRVGAETVGVDIEPQPYFEARFGGESFILHDAFDMDKLRELVRRLKPLMVWASPNCQGYSTAPHVGSASKVERLIPLLRSMLLSLGIPFVIENVTGAKADMIRPLSVWGQLFGRHQDRERLLESGGGLVLRHEATLEGPGQLLREQSCLGRRRRFPRRDPFGRLIHPKGPRVCAARATYLPRKARRVTMDRWQTTRSLWASIRGTWTTKVCHRQSCPTTHHTWSVKQLCTC